jgi:polyferredoxin
MSQKENFRDKISTIDESGKRAWIYPKKPKGKFFNYRKILTYFLLVLMFAGPHLRIAGKPVLLFNILERKFVIFGQIFWPNDFYIFAVAMIVLVVFITLFTIVFGRLFCGWICPQTIFMEMIFRRIE